MTTVNDLLHLPPCVEPARMTTDQIRDAQRLHLCHQIMWHHNADLGYAEALTNLCDRLHARPHFGWRGDCPRRLNNRQHRCSHNSGADRLGVAIDHPVWLRWADGCWGLLSQTYNEREDYDTLTGLGYQVQPLGAAPYGNGTGALLILGADCSPLVP